MKAAASGGRSDLAQVRRGPDELSDVGTLAGRYRLGSLLGTGGMGEVFEAEHLLTGRIVAVKRVPARLLKTLPDAERQVLQEAAACGQLRHPNVVEILDAGWSDGDLFLVFERLYGHTLEQGFRQRRITPRALVRVCVRLFDALEAVHASGWVHRDIKPANLLLARDASEALQLKLIDFGISVRMASAPGVVVGTLDYMSPEQARGQAVDGRADIWSVGAVLFRGVTGHLPHPQLSSEHRWACDRPPPSPYEHRPELPLDVCGFIRRCLQPDPNLRWPSASAAMQALLAVNEGKLAGLAPPEFGAVSSETVGATESWPERTAV